MLSQRKLEKALWKGKLARFKNRYFSFKYPVEGAVIAIKRGEAEAAWEMLINLEGTEFNYKIILEPRNMEAEKCVLELFKANDIPGRDNVHPFKLILPNLQGWRCVVSFKDGKQTPLMLDTVYVESAHRKVFRLQYAVEPEEYERGLVFFELMVRTFKLSRRG
jgi:hypothetical protein